jgi:hypothetical protein
LKEKRCLEELEGRRRLFERAMEIEEKMRSLRKGRG